MREIIAKVIIDDVKYKKAKSNISNKQNFVNTNTNYISMDEISLKEKLDNNDMFFAIQTFVIAENTIDTTISHINDNVDSKKSSSQVIRHKIAQMSSEIECYKQFICSVCNGLELSNNLEKEILMSKLISIQLMDKVVSECFEIFGAYDSLQDHPLEKVYQKSKMIKILNNKTDLHENIAKFIIEKNN